MKYVVDHTTTYNYTDAVAVSYNVIHLSPRDGERQRLENTTLDIRPTPAVAHHRQDYFGNRVDIVTVQEPHTELVIAATSTVEVFAPPDYDPASTLPWETVREILFRNQNREILSACEFAYDSPMLPPSPAAAKFAAAAFPPGRPLLAGVIELNRMIYSGFKYDPNATSISTPVEEVMAARAGVCQDFAHIGIACMRSLGLAARYVSGYLETIPPPGRPRLVGADASHAWFSVYIPSLGWVDADPTNGILVRDRHVTAAIGRDFSDVSPIKGMIIGGGPQTVKVAVDVLRSELSA
jgi:transglutaminase-like putative cysteine protease